MKRIFACLIACFLLFGVLYPQVRQEQADIVVMMDTSGTILPYYDDINKRVLNEINSKFIREGDMFHLISFTAKPHHEISQKITGEADLSKIVSRFMLLYQLGQNSDLLTAFDYAKDFTRTLNTANKEKILIIISDGIFNPPKTSPYATYTPEQLKNKISRIASDIRSDNWKVYFVKLPFPDNVIIRNLDGDVVSGIAETAGTSSTGGTATDRNNTTANAGDNGTTTALSENNGTVGRGSDTTGNGFSGNSADSTVGSGENTDTGISGTGQADSSSDVLANGSGADPTGITDDSDGRKKSDTSGWTSTANEDAANGSVNVDSGKVETGDNGVRDISGDVTGSLGVTPSELNPDPNIALTLNEDRQKLPKVQFPSSLEALGTQLSVPLKITNESDEPVQLTLENITMSNGVLSAMLPVKNGAVTINPGETVNLDAKVQLPKKAFPKGNYNPELRLNFADNKSVLPQVATLPLTVKPTWFENFYQSGRFWIALAILGAILLLLLLLLFFLLRGRGSHSISHALGDSTGHESLNKFSAASTGAEQATRQASNAYANTLAEQRLAEAREHSAFLNKTSNEYSPNTHYSEQPRLRVNRNLSGMTEIYVFNQTRSIGKRNIHVMKPGTQLSVGGGKGDDFFIFLVKFPANLASVRYDGKDYHLTIHKPQYFPYIKGGSVNNCIGKTITIVSDKGYHVGFTFREYEDPISKLNTILTSIDYN